MADEELMNRLNDAGYTNWLKAGRCLLLLRDGLQPFLEREMRSFHRGLCGRSSALRTPCRSSCRARGAKVSLCELCSAWQQVILTHHRQPGVTVNWENCSPPSWRTNSWEVAKAYMPRGQAKVKGADGCDASALLNLVNHCDQFSSVNQNFVKAVIHCRNDLMHSPELRVTDAWLKEFKNMLENLVKQFRHVPEMEMTGQSIKKLLMQRWSICISGLDHTDAASFELPQTESLGQWEVTTGLISQWEVELLEERLQDLLRDEDEDEDEDGDMHRTNTDTWVTLGGFLEANSDLAERFSAQVKAIHSLHKKV